MRFVERKEFLYDMAIFGLKSTATALRIHREWTRKYSPIPAPKFMEVDRRSAKMDALWHVPLDDRTVFSRTLDIPCINTQEKPQWHLTKIGMVPQRRDKFTLSNLILQEFDYFPIRGDLVFFNGYRYMIINVVIEPNAYWHQTNVWMGLVCECIIPPEGDARPIPNLGIPAPAEISQTQPFPSI